MASGLTWIKFKKTGVTKEISTKIANNKDYQNDPDRGFTIIGAPIQESNPEPQKKIADKPEPKKVVAEKNEEAKGENSDEELGAGVETEDLSGQQETGKSKPAAKAETVEDKIIRLHKAGKNIDEIKAETGINKNIIKGVVNKIK